MLTSMTASSSISLATVFVGVMLAEQQLRTRGELRTDARCSATAVAAISPGVRDWSALRSWSSSKVLIDPAATAVRLLSQTLRCGALFPSRNDVSCLTFGGFRARSGRLNGMAPERVQNRGHTGLLVHLCGRAEWEDARQRGGFARVAHTRWFRAPSTPGQVHLPANRLFVGRSDLCAVWVDPDELQSPLRWEPGVPGILNRCSSHICVRSPAGCRGGGGRVPTGRAG